MAGSMKSALPRVSHSPELIRPVAADRHTINPTVDPIFPAGSGGPPCLLLSALYPHVSTKSSDGSLEAYVFWLWLPALVLPTCLANPCVWWLITSGLRPIRCHPVLWLSSHLPDMGAQEARVLHFSQGLSSYGTCAFDAFGHLFC